VQDDLTAARPPLPFSGVRVVALEQAVAAPFCSRQLADLGAEVVKVERPGGDPARHYDGVLNGVSAYFAWLNRGKRSVVLNLKIERDRALCLRLLGRADVFIHNLAPGAVERLGFGFDDLRLSCPSLIWCGISGYGPDGPQRLRKAYDLLIQAESGVVSVTGTGDAPAKVGISIADLSAGLYAYSSILAALIQRGRTGRGERIDISMLECLAEWMMPPVHVWQGSGVIPPRMGVRHNMIVPYGAYACADGPVVFAVQTDREWRRLCSDVLRAPELATDERFATNARRVMHREALEMMIEDRLRLRSRHDAQAALGAADIPTGEINDVPAVAAHPQLVARRRWATAQTEAGPVTALVPPHNLRQSPSLMGAVPGLGEHTDAVLAELAASS